MNISKAERALLVDELRRIAARLAGAPAHTEELAEADLARYCATRSTPNAHRDTDRYPYQVGGLSQICTGSARDIEAIIRRIGGGA